MNRHRGPKAVQRWRPAIHSQSDERPIPIARASRHPNRQEPPCTQCKGTPRFERASAAILLRILSSTGQRSPERVRRVTARKRPWPGLGALSGQRSVGRSLIPCSSRPLLPELDRAGDFSVYQMPVVRQTRGSGRLQSGSRLSLHPRQFAIRALLVVIEPATPIGPRLTHTSGTPNRASTRRS